MLGIKEKWHLPFIVISLLIAYLNTLNHGFVLDDIAVIESNRFVKAGFNGIPDILTTFYWEGFWDSNSGLYRPLSLISFAIEWQISPNNPFIHHFFNVFYYILVCTLLYVVLKKWFKSIDSGIVFLIVILFVVHPIHTEVVANIKSRDELLALLFFLISAVLFIPATFRSAIISSLFFFLALLSKEGAVMLLPILFFHFYLSERFSFSQFFKISSPFLFVTAIWLFIHQQVIENSSKVISYTYADNSLLAIDSFVDQKATALGILARYFVKIFFPYEMSYDYSLNQIPSIGLLSIPALFGLLMLFCAVFLFLKMYKKDAFLSMSIAFVLLPLLLTSNLFFKIGATAADRFLFVSTIGSCMLMVYIPFYYFKFKNVNSLKYLAVAVWIVFVSMTFKRNKVWKDNYSLFENDVNVSKNSARTHYNYGTALLRNLKPSDNKLLLAKKELAVSLKIDPDYFDAMINLGTVYNTLKMYDSAIVMYKRAMKLNDNALIAGNLGESFFRNNQNDSSVFYLTRSHQLGNDPIESYNFLGTAFFNLNKYTEACKIFEKGIAKDSTNWNLFLNYGNALVMNNKDKEAIVSFNKSYQLNPGNTKTLYFLAITYNKMGDTLNANKFYNEFKKYNP
jgi:tetratricopeptide (TPR) repeat protein